MPDDSVVVQVGADISGLSSGLAGAKAEMAETATAAERMAKQFMASGLTANEAAAALKNLGYSAKDAAAAAGLLATAQSEANVAVTASVASMSGLERASAMAGARIAGEFVPGLGMAGYQVGRVASMLPGIGTLFAIAFPVALIAFAAEKIKEFNDNLLKTQEEMTDLTIKTRDSAGAIELQNLKLEDEISTLERKPKRNALLEALEESKEEADRVGEAIATDLTKMRTLLEAGTGIFSQLFAGKANESVLADAIKPIERQYQLAVLAQDQTAERNALLEAQATIQKAITDEEAQQVQIIQGVSGRTFTFGREPDVKAVQDYKEALSQVQSELKELDALTVNTNLHTHLGSLQAAKDIDDYWIKFVQKPEKPIDREAYFKGLVLAAKEANEQMLEDRAVTDKQMSDNMARVGKQEMEINIANAKEVEAEVQTVMKGAEAERAAASGGAVGPFAKLIDSAAAAHEMEIIRNEMQKVQDEIGRLKGSMAEIQRQPFLSESDEAILRAYQGELKNMVGLLQQLGTKYAELGRQVETASQGMQHAADVAFDNFNQGFIRMLEGGQTFGRTMQQVWTQMATTFISSSLRILEQMIVNAALQKSIAANTKLSDAGAAARHTYASASAIPLIGWIIAPVAAAAAFAAVLAFEKGGLVPGGRGEAVPVVAHAGEAVLPAKLTNFLVNAASSGAASGNAGRSINVNYSPTIHAIDTRGVSDMMREHASIMAEALAGELRRRNAA